ncbi:hypothetical protein Hanom_Chr13g01242711 [Helianthus anomalus]
MTRGREELFVKPLTTRIWYVIPWKDKYFNSGWGCFEDMKTMYETNKKSRKKIFMILVLNLRRLIIYE